MSSLLAHMKCEPVLSPFSDKTLPFILKGTSVSMCARRGFNYKFSCIWVIQDKVLVRDGNLAVKGLLEGGVCATLFQAISCLMV